MLDRGELGTIQRALGWKGPAKEGILRTDNTLEEDSVFKQLDELQRIRRKTLEWAARGDKKREKQSLREVQARGEEKRLQRRGAKRIKKEQVQNKSRRASGEVEKAKKNKRQKGRGMTKRWKTEIENTDPIDYQSDSEEDTDSDAKSFEEGEEKITVKKIVKRNDKLKKVEKVDDNKTKKAKAVEANTTKPGPKVSTSKKTDDVKEQRTNQPEAPKKPDNKNSVSFNSSSLPKAKPTTQSSPSQPPPPKTTNGINADTNRKKLRRRVSWRNPVLSRVRIIEAREASEVNDQQSKQEQPRQGQPENQPKQDEANGHKSREDMPKKDRSKEKKSEENNLKTVYRPPFVSEEADPENPATERQSKNPTSSSLSRLVEHIVEPYPEPWSHLLPPKEHTKTSSLVVEVPSHWGASHSKTGPSEPSSLVVEAPTSARISPFSPKEASNPPSLAVEPASTPRSPLHSENEGPSNPSSLLVEPATSPKSSPLLRQEPRNPPPSTVERPLSPWVYRLAARGTTSNLSSVVVEPPTSLRSSPLSVEKKATNPSSLAVEPSTSARKNPSLPRWGAPSQALASPIQEKRLHHQHGAGTAPASRSAEVKRNGGFKLKDTAQGTIATRRQDRQTTMLQAKTTPSKLVHPLPFRPKTQLFKERLAFFEKQAAPQGPPSYQSGASSSLASSFQTAKTHQTGRTVGASEASSSSFHTARTHQPRSGKSAVPSDASSALSFVTARTRLSQSKTAPELGTPTGASSNSSTEIVYSRSADTARWDEFLAHRSLGLPSKYNGPGLCYRFCGCSRCVLARTSERGSGR